MVPMAEDQDKQKNQEAQQIADAEQTADAKKASEAEVVVRQNKPERDLMEASCNGDIERTTKLLHASTNPNTCDEDGDTPLIVAVSWGHADIVRTLIAAGADPDLPNNEGETPLVRAAVFMPFIETTVVMKALLDCGADPNKGDANGDNAYLWAIRVGNKEGAEYLHSRGVLIPENIF